MKYLQNWNSLQCFILKHKYVYFTQFALSWIISESEHNLTRRTSQLISKC